MSFQVVRAAFIPFGDLVDVQIPLDYETEKHRGFAFIEFELQEDAQAAIENMVSIQFKVVDMSRAITIYEKFISLKFMCKRAEKVLNSFICSIV